MKTTTKICTKCKTSKELSEYNVRKLSKDGFTSRCKICLSVSDKEYYHTIKGICYNLFYAHVHRSKLKSFAVPLYTKIELKEWIINQDNFKELYENWVNSNYKKELSLSVDRLDDYKGYSFDNIQLVTWEFNNKKGHDDMKNGINNKNSKSVLKYSMNGEFLGEYYSIRSVARILGVSERGIIRCCKGKQKYANGFKWKYKKQ